MPDPNIGIVRRVLDVFNSGDLTVLDELVAEDYVNHDAPPGATPGRDGRKQVVSMFRRGFPDIDSRVVDVIADGDKVVVRINLRGTQNGDFMGRPPSGHLVDVSGIDIFRVVDGRVTERWGVLDMFGLTRQLDASPTT